ncbi:hypothetical protein TUBRATIS_003680 [Tubulinosema ratisbonensis]|uniref:Uncharacterized protein n=1 Tax=Tubulinosema ratisbonensis TaxID=291195 RepID=A0A437AQ42_9MICR|nr:hypothetical protein TUBRATIS_003680 [Tubulinosema ratisbonensis]
MFLLLLTTILKKVVLMEIFTFEVDWAISDISLNKSQRIKLYHFSESLKSTLSNHNSRIKFWLSELELDFNFVNNLTQNSPESIKVIEDEVIRMRLTDIPDKEHEDFKILLINQLTEFDKYFPGEYIQGTAEIMKNIILLFKNKNNLVRTGIFISLLKMSEIFKLAIFKQENYLKKLKQLLQINNIKSYTQKDLEFFINNIFLKWYITLFGRVNINFRFILLDCFICFGNDFIYHFSLQFLKELDNIYTNESYFNFEIEVKKHAILDIEEKTLISLLKTTINSLITKV